MNKVIFAVLHDPVLFGGKTFGPRLDPKIQSGLSLTEDVDRDQLVIEWTPQANQKFVTRIPIATVKQLSLESENQNAPPAPENKSSPQVAKVSAQVETPQSHVHAGLGKGKK